MKATDVLKKDHETVKGLFREFRGLDDHDLTGKRRLFAEIDRELSVHAAIEEEIFYPAVKGVDSEEAAELVLEAHEEHAIVKTLLSQIRSQESGDETFDAKMKVLMEAVEHHAEEEERELFDEAKELEDETLRELGQRLLDRKKSLLAAGVPAEPRSKRTLASPRGRSKRATGSSSASARSSSKRAATKTKARTGTVSRGRPVSTRAR